MPGSCDPAEPPKHSTNEQNVSRTQRPTIATPAIYKLTPRESTKDAGTSIRFPGPVWTHGCIQLGMHICLCRHIFERACARIMPNILHITAPQFTELEQIGQSTVDPISLLFGSFLFHAVGTFPHANPRNYANQNSTLARLFIDVGHESGRASGGAGGGPTYGLHSLRHYKVCRRAGTPREEQNRHPAAIHRSDVE